MDFVIAFICFAIVFECECVCVFLCACFSVFLFRSIHLFECFCIQCGLATIG